MVRLTDFTLPVSEHSNNYRITDSLYLLLKITVLMSISALAN
ncbi:hypothetical protein [Candidatus Gullanella endobia]|nr:hypothetical protein [Candidatus Gullanella endobia]